jgi:hypothetical protein
MGAIPEGARHGSATTVRAITTRYPTMSARASWNAKSPRKRPNKSRRKYLPDVEGLETLQLMSVFGDISNFFQGAANDVQNFGQQAVNDIENFANQAIGEISNGAQNAIGAIKNFGSQLLSTVANDVQMVESTVTSGLSQIGTAVGNFFPQAASAVTGAISQLGTAVSGEISQVSGQVSSDLQTFVSDASAGLQSAQTDLTAAFNTASSSFTSGFEAFGNGLKTAITSPVVEAGLSYELDGLMIIGGVALMASEEFDGPVGAIGGATLIGAGIQGIEYNVQNTNSDGTVNGNWSWSGYGENLGIGAATGFVSGGIGVLGGGVVLGAVNGAASGALNQFLTNAADGQSLGTNVGAAAGLGALGGGLFGALSEFAGSETGKYTASVTNDLAGAGDSALQGAVMTGTEASSSLEQSFADLAMQAGVDVQDLPTAIPLPDGPPMVAIPGTDPVNTADLPTAIPLPDGEPQYAIPVPNEAPAPVTTDLPGSNTLSPRTKLALRTVLKDALKTFVAPQASGIASGTLSDLQSLLGLGSGTTGSNTPTTPQQFATDLTAYFNAASAPAPNGYLQSVTSGALPFGNGTALVGIGGDNAVYVNEQVPGTGTTGWVDLGGYAKSIAVTTYGIASDSSHGLPAIYAIGSDNAVYFNQQESSGQWSGWTDLSQGGAIFQSITATISPNNTAEVYAIGFDNAVYTQWQGSSGNWSGWANLGGSGVKQIAATPLVGGGSGLFALGSNNVIYYDQYTPGQGWSGFSYISQGGTFKQIAAGMSYSGNPEVYGLGFDNAVYTEIQNGAGWTALTNLGGNVQSIATSRSASQTVYAIDASNNVVEDRYLFGGGDANRYAYWTGFQNLGSGFKAVTAAGTQVYGLGPDNHVYSISPTSGKTDVGGYTPTMALGGHEVDVALGSDHSVYVDEQNADGSWTGAIDLGGYLKSVSAFKTPNGAPVVIGIDYNHDVWVDEQTPYGTWGGWTELPAQILADKAVGAIAPNGAPEVVASDINGSVFVTTQNPNGSWNGWYTTGGVVKSFAVAQDPSGGAAIAAVGMDNAAWVDEQRADGTWAGFTRLGGSFQSISAAQAPDGGLAIVGLGTDGTVSVDEQSFAVNEANYSSAASWNGLVNLGGNFTSVMAVNSGFGTLDVITQDSSGNESVNIQTTGSKWSGFMAFAKPKTTS